MGTYQEASRKIKVLFLENGVSGGGSFEGLYQIVTRLNPEVFYPIVVFVNRTHFYQKLREKRIKVFIVKDLLYSVKTGIWIKRLITKLNTLIELLLPFWAVYFEYVIHLPSIIALKKIIKQYEVDIIHLNNQSLRDLYGIIVAQKTGIPCLSHLRSVRVSRVNPYKIRFINSQVSKFVANSNFTRNYWVEIGIVEEKIITLYNAIEFSTVRPLNVKKEWRLSENIKVIVGCVGNLVDSKGQEFLILAFADVLKKKTSVFTYDSGGRRI